MAESNIQAFRTGNEVRPRAQDNNPEARKKNGGEDFTELYPRRQRSAARMRQQKQERIEGEKREGASKLSGFGFTMILGVALLKDTIDVLGVVANLIIFSFGSTALAGVTAYAIFDSIFAGFLGAIIPNFIKLTGIGAGAIGAINLGLSVTFSLAMFFFSLFLFSIILMYLGFQRISITARKLATVAASFIIGVLPLLNWLPETFIMLLILKHYEKDNAEKNSQKGLGGSQKIDRAEPAPA